MRHPLIRGFLLALGLTAALTLGAAADISPERIHPAQMAMVPVGALLAALPGRILHRKNPRPRTNRRRCLRGLLGGFGGMLGAGLAAGGWAFQGLLALGTGGVGSAAFLGTALIMALICSWAQRRELE